MNISKFKLMIILLMIGVFVGIGIPNVKASDYFPLEVGNRWVYTPSYGDGDRIDTIVGTEDVNGTFTYIVSERKFRILSHAEEVNSMIPNNHIGKTDVFLHSCTHIKRNCFL